MFRDFFYLIQGGGILQHVIVAVLLGFQIWMFVDAIRRGDYIWAAFIFFFSIISALIYYFLVCRPAGGGNPFAGMEIPGAADRRRIATLKEEIHHLDRAHHHLELGDIYREQGRLAQAEECYRAAYARDEKDEDIRARLGACLVARGKAAEGLPLLAAVCAQNPKHDYGDTLMSLAEAQAAAGRTDEALATWRQVLAGYSYARARVQYAQLLVQKKEFAEARKLLEGVIEDEPYTAKFQREREEPWTRKARELVAGLPR